MSAVICQWLYDIWHQFTIQPPKKRAELNSHAEITKIESEWKIWEKFMRLLRVLSYIIIEGLIKISFVWWSWFGTFQYLKWVSSEKSLIDGVSATNRCLQYSSCSSLSQNRNKIRKNMLLRYFKTTFKGNLVSNQICGFPRFGKCHTRLLSTSPLSRNQYDDLYAARWATFQCKLSNSIGKTYFFRSFPYQNIHIPQVISQSHSLFIFSSFLSHLRKSLSFFFVREYPYKMTTK